MSGLLMTAVRRAGPVLRTQAVSQRAHLYTRPAKEKIGVVESVIAMSMLSFAILGPSGWILAHLEDYKKKE